MNNYDISRNPHLHLQEAAQSQIGKGIIFVMMKITMLDVTGMEGTVVGKMLIKNIALPVNVWILMNNLPQQQPPVRLPLQPQLQLVVIVSIQVGLVMIIVMMVTIILGVIGMEEIVVDILSTQNFVPFVNVWIQIILENFS